MIMIVDDEPLVLTITQLMVKRIGFEVITAENGEQALALYRRHMPGIDGVILDVTMPGMPLGEICKQLKMLDDDVKILLASGLEPAAEVRTVMDAYGFEFILKPFDQHCFRRMLNRLVAPRRTESVKESASL